MTASQLNCKDYNLRNYFPLNFEDMITSLLVFVGIDVSLIAMDLGYFYLFKMVSYSDILNFPTVS